MGGYLITIEGIGGGGKTTLASALDSWLTSYGVTVVRTREPGGTLAGAAIRDLILASGQPLAPLTETFLFEADRSETYARVIAPAIQAGSVVISDRNLYGTIAYQAFGEGVDLALVDTASSAASGGISPDLILVLDLPVEVANQRLSAIGGGDRLDQREADFQQRVRSGYRFAAERDRLRARIISADRPARSVSSEAESLVAELLQGDYPRLSSCLETPR